MTSDNDLNTAYRKYGFPPNPCNSMREVSPFTYKRDKDDAEPKNACQEQNAYNNKQGSYHIYQKNLLLVWISHESNSFICKIFRDEVIP